MITLSTKRLVKCAFPQSSVLSPLLCLIHIKHLPHAVFNSSVTLFANDTAIVTNRLVKVEELQNDIDRVDQRMKNDKVTVKATNLNCLDLSRLKTTSY